MLGLTGSTEAALPSASSLKPEPRLDLLPSVAFLSSVYLGLFVIHLVALSQALLFLQMDSNVCPCGCCLKPFLAALLSGLGDCPFFLCFAVSPERSRIVSFFS